MPLRASIVLEDCKHALDLLQKETEPDTFRVLWVAGIALARAVGHVLRNVDRTQDELAKKAVTSAFESWKADKVSNSIFWEFIDIDRNQLLKQYEINFLAGPIDVIAGNEAFTLDENLYCPINKGAFAGEDCRDILEQAIEWWEQQLKAIEADIQGSSEK